MTLIWKHKSNLIVCLWTGKTLSALSGTLFLFPLDITESGLHKTTHDVFLQLDNYYLDHATLLIESYENIIDIFIYCVNRHDNLQETRKLEQSNPDDNTNQTVMDVVMDDTTVPGALSAQGSSSLFDLTLSYMEVLMNSWKPVTQTIMQQFDEFDNEGYDI